MERLWAPQVDFTRISRNASSSDFCQTNSLSVNSLSNNQQSANWWIANIPFLCLNCPSCTLLRPYNPTSSAIVSVDGRPRRSNTSPEQRASTVTNRKARCQSLTNHRKVRKTFQRPTKIVLKTCRGKLELNILTVQPFKKTKLIILQ